MMKVVCREIVEGTTKVQYKFVELWMDGGDTMIEKK